MVGILHHYQYQAVYVENVTYIVTSSH